jgi:spermidine synthase
MSPLPYEELAYASTPMGEISLRKRYDRLTGRWVHEVRLGDEYLMSSQFNATEIALARLGLAEAQGEDLRVMVAGLGLGFTAHEALRDPRTSQLSVLELVGAVIDWRRRDLVPDTRGLAADPRCELIEADFFEVVRSGRCPEVDVLLVDIDHSPDNLLSPTHSDFYEASGLQAAADAISDHGVFALWSDDAPDDRVLARLRGAFTRARAEVVDFDNPITGGTSSCTVYVASLPLGRP